MPFQTQEVKRVETLCKNDFYNQYYKTQTPVIISNLTHQWGAYKDWTFDYLLKKAGNINVPLYNNNAVDYTKKVNEPDTIMPLADYFSLLQSSPTDLRVFLYNILKNVPQLQQDIQTPDLGLPIMKGLPMLFIGGKGSSVFMHYDIDLANIFHFHFIGKKRCLLVPPNQSKYMYKVPFSCICREDIDFKNPDYNKFPALKNIQAFVADLQHGDMLYMPEGYWHYMTYETPGVSISLRSIARRPNNLLNAVNNVFFVRNYDNLMRKLKGKSWIDYKNKKALESTNARFKKTTQA